MILQVLTNTNECWHWYISLTYMFLAIRTITVNKNNIKIITNARLLKEMKPFVMYKI